MPTLKCVVMGDGSVGKTCLLIRYAKDEFPTAYVPTIFDSYAVSLPIQGETYDLHLFDTAGQEEFDQLRRLAFSNTDILLVCFAVDYWPSFENVRAMWVPELRKYCPEVPYILVGTRTDLRNDQTIIAKLSAQGKSLISKSQGDHLAKELGAVMYVECSALTNENVDDVFREAIITALTVDDTPSPPTTKVEAAGPSNIPSSSLSNNNNNNNNSNNHKSTQENDACCCCCNSENCSIL